MKSERGNKEHFWFVGAIVVSLAIISLAMVGIEKGPEWFNVSPRGIPTPSVGK